MQNISEHGNFTIDDQLYSKQDVAELILLQLALLTEENKLFTIEECENIWHGYSAGLCASWLCFPDNINEIVATIKSSDYFVSFEYYILQNR